MQYENKQKATDAADSAKLNNQNKMKNYNVVFEANGEIISTFEIQADNLVEAKKLAQHNKQMAVRGRRCSTRVYLSK